MQWKISLQEKYIELKEVLYAISKDNVSVRYVVEEDAPIISKWLTDPEVLQYYEGRDDPQSVEMVLNHFIHNPNSPEKGA